jgi:hypothetical protein
MKRHHNSVSLQVNHKFLAGRNNFIFDRGESILKLKLLKDWILSISEHYFRFRMNWESQIISSFSNWRRLEKRLPNTIKSISGIASNLQPNKYSKYTQIKLHVCEGDNSENFGSPFVSKQNWMNVHFNMEAVLFKLCFHCWNFGAVMVFHNNGSG